MLLIEESSKMFKAIENRLTQRDIEAIAQLDYSDLYLLHFGLGISIRNMLADDPDLCELFYKNGFLSLDDMSDFIIKLFWLHLKEGRM